MTIKIGLPLAPKPTGYEGAYPFTKYCPFCGGDCGEC